jgi:hypothetical protein
MQKVEIFAHYTYFRKFQISNWNEAAPLSLCGS